jgi:hypothetical protein
MPNDWLQDEALSANQCQGIRGSPPSGLSLQVSGVWFSISMASDNLTRIEENGDLRVFVRSIEHLKNSSLKFNFHFM